MGWDTRNSGDEGEVYQQDSDNVIKRKVIVFSSPKGRTAICKSVPPPPPPAPDLSELSSPPNPVIFIFSLLDR